MLTCGFDALLLAGSSLYSGAGSTAVYLHKTWTQSTEGLALAADGQQ
jgi:hypothetical protein